MAHFLESPGWSGRYHMIPTFLDALWQCKTKPLHFFNNINNDYLDSVSIFRIFKVIVKPNCSIFRTITLISFRCPNVLNFIAGKCFLWTGLLHGPPMLVDKTKFGLVLYNHANHYRFEETSSYWSVKPISVTLCFSLVNQRHTSGITVHNRTVTKIENTLGALHSCNSWPNTCIAQLAVTSNLFWLEIYAVWSGHFLFPQVMNVKLFHLAYPKQIANSLFFIYFFFFLTKSSISFNYSELSSQ